MIKIDRRVMVAATAGLIALAVACGGDDDAASQSSPTRTPTRAPAPAAAAPTVVVPTVGSVADGGAASGGAASAAVTSEGSVFTWEVTTVDDGTKPAIALKADGTPYVAYMLEAMPGFVKNAAKTADGWDITTVKEGYFYGPLDIAIGPDDVPRIAYHDHQDTTFKPDKGDATVATLTGGVWNSVAAADKGHDGWDNRIIVDDQNVVHMTGVDPKDFGGDGVEYYTLNPDGTWTVENVGSGKLTYQFATSLALDPDGNPNVTFYNQPENDLGLSTRNPDGTWTVSTVDSAGDTGLFAQMLIDDTGRFHISYGSQPRSTALTIKYATRGPGETDWTITEIDTVQNFRTGFDGARDSTSIALDSKGNPVIAYSDLDKVKVAVWDGSQWLIDTVAVAISNDFGQIVSLKLDANDNAHIAFAETTRRTPLQGIVKYALGTRD